MRENPWTDERKALLKLWWLVDQRTSADIVELFHQRGFTTTRNAIIGAVHRSGWWEGLSRKLGPPRPGRKPGEKREKKREKIEPPPPPPVRLRTPPSPPAPKLVPGQPMFLSVVQIGPSQCRYWYGESWRDAGRKHETGYCGHPVSPGHRSWCDAHLRLVYAKTPHAGQPRISVPHKF